MTVIDPSESPRSLGGSTVEIKSFCILNLFLNELKYNTSIILNIKDARRGVSAFLKFQNNFSFPIFINFFLKHLHCERFKMAMDSQDAPQMIEHLRKV